MENKWKCLLKIQVLTLLTILSINRSSLAVDHVVGDLMWTIPTNNDFYNKWANNRSFTVGDYLVFKFEMGFYNVIKVGRREFEDCNVDNALQTFLKGPATVRLDRDGMHYFLCSFGNYCFLGMKVAISAQQPSAT